MSDEQDHAKIIANHLSAKSGRHVWPAGAVSNSKLKISEKAHDEKTLTVIATGFCGSSRVIYHSLLPLAGLHQVPEVLSNAVDAVAEWVR